MLTKKNLCFDFVFADVGVVDAVDAEVAFPGQVVEVGVKGVVDATVGDYEDGLVGVIGFEAIDGFVDSGEEFFDGFAVFVFWL